MYELLVRHTLTSYMYLLETQSNKLDKIYEESKKVWLGDYFEKDEDGGNLALQGRVMEMLSEHTVEVSLGCILKLQD